MEKKCGSCGEVKPLIDFAKKATAKDGRQSMCRSCKNAWNKNNYTKNYQAERTRLAANVEKYYEINSLYVVTLKSTTPCADCKIQYPHPAMEFDHLSDKAYNVSMMLRSFPLERIKQEISKCQIVCANCHRIRTHNRDVRRKYPTVFIP